MSKKFPAWKEQIKSPKWQKKRLEVLSLRGFKCEECGDKEKTLHVHHRFYISGRLIHEYDNDVLQVLCEDCHKKEHNKTDYSKYDELISLIELNCKLFDIDILEDLEFILDTIFHSDEDKFISNLSNAFNDGFYKKISIDLETNTRLERIEVELSMLKKDHGK